MPFSSDELLSQSESSPDRGGGHVKLIGVGNDEDLLSYREKVLTQAGFRVVSLRPQAAHPDQFASLCRLHGPAMIIACHTLTAPQRIRLSQEARESCPRARLLALTNGHLSQQEAQEYDLLIDSLDGPAALIQHIRTNL